jgi:sugar-specific transcriptional regulator TrmB
MNLETMLKTLALIGFFQSDAEIYLHLTLEGPKCAYTIAEKLKMPHSQVYRVLRRLGNKSIITVSAGHPMTFSAAPFEEVLDLFKKSTIEDAKHLEQNKKEILCIWQSIVQTNKTES